MLLNPMLWLFESGKLLVTVQFITKEQSLNNNNLNQNF